MRFGTLLQKHSKTPIWKQPMATTTYAADRSAPLIVDPTTI
jgi:hypothetical protein